MMRSRMAKEERKRVISERARSGMREEESSPEARLKGLEHTGLITKRSVQFDTSPSDLKGDALQNLVAQTPRESVFSPSSPENVSPGVAGSAFFPVASTPTCPAAEKLPANHPVVTPQDMLEAQTARSSGVLLQPLFKELELAQQQIGEKRTLHLQPAVAKTRSCLYVTAMASQLETRRVALGFGDGHIAIYQAYRAFGKRDSGLHQTHVFRAALLGSDGPLRKGCKRPPSSSNRQQQQTQQHQQQNSDTSLVNVPTALSLPVSLTELRLKASGRTARGFKKKRAKTQQGERGGDDGKQKPRTGSFQNAGGEREVQRDASGVDGEESEAHTSVKSFGTSKNAEEENEQSETATEKIAAQTVTANTSNLPEKKISDDDEDTLPEAERRALEDMRRRGASGKGGTGPPPALPVKSDPADVVACLEENPLEFVRNILLAGFESGRVAMYRISQAFDLTIGVASGEGKEGVPFSRLVGTPLIQTDPGEEPLLRQHSHIHKGPVVSVEFVPSLGVVSVAGDGSIAAVDLTFRHLWQMNADGSSAPFHVACCDISSRLGLLAVASQCATVQIWDATTRKKRGEFPVCAAETLPVVTVAFVGKSHHAILSVLESGVVSIHSSAILDCLLTCRLPHLGGSVSCCYFDREVSQLVLCAKSLSFWTLEEYGGVPVVGRQLVGFSTTDTWEPSLAPEHTRKAKAPSGVQGKKGGQRSLNLSPSEFFDEGAVVGPHEGAGGGRQRGRTSAVADATRQTRNRAVTINSKRTWPEEGAAGEQTLVALSGMGGDAEKGEDREGGAGGGRKSPGSKAEDKKGGESGGYRRSEKEEEGDGNVVPGVKWPRTLSQGGGGVELHSAVSIGFGTGSGLVCVDSVGVATVWSLERGSLESSFFLCLPGEALPTKASTDVR
uniref:Uncharacterized protein n=1 Tax=Chromera velia CCMP2878 TaxID=1169474 RepID=A0A0G4FH20_9ALVE|eukprot:Cvel_17002.t1-p1 / transcript=Cvel_17002.t1 / gene=Cvel_17002 / organism=Chromera_velia_CCMP2878 / gene_product=hypothetical protein / transcript_product=hypothetical protein / location=Cvel_scaffold1336:17482-22093(-) / protein_length=898 / sequence_SO=supercontig / SO=protein_coding / is_pseudo=false